MGVDTQKRPVSGEWLAKSHTAYTLRQEGLDAWECSLGQEIQDQKFCLSFRQGSFRPSNVQDADNPTALWSIAAVIGRFNESDRKPYSFALYFTSAGPELASEQLFACLHDRVAT